VPEQAATTAQVGAEAGGAAEPVGEFWARCGAAWEHLQAAAHERGGQTVAVVTHSPVISALLCHCLGLTPAALNLFRCASVCCTHLRCMAGTLCRMLHIQGGFFCGWGCMWHSWTIVCGTPSAMHELLCMLDAPAVDSLASVPNMAVTFQALLLLVFLLCTVLDRRVPAMVERTSF
jgi:hypothetical protein